MIRKFPDSSLFLCTHSDSGTDIWVEVIKHENGLSEEMIQQIDTEIGYRKVLSNISTLCRTINIVRKQKETIFMSENVHSQSIFELVNNGPLPIQQTKYMFFLLCYTVFELQNRGYAIRDWAPVNFCFFSTMVKYYFYRGIVHNTHYVIENAMPWIGDVRWMAPEMFCIGEFDIIKSSIYCLGLYLFLMMKGAPIYTFDTPRNIYKTMFHLNNELLDVGDPDANSLLEKMLNKDPKKRPNIEEILHDPFLKPVKPFPHYHPPSKIDIETEKWLLYLGYKPKICLEDAKSLEICENNLALHISLAAVSRGNYITGTKMEKKINLADYYAFPEYLPEKEKDNVSIRPKTSRSELKTSKPNHSIEIEKIVRFCKSRLSERGKNVETLGSI